MEDLHKPGRMDSRLARSLAHSHVTLSLSLAMAPNCNHGDYSLGNLTPTLPPALLYQSAYCRNQDRETLAALDTSLQAEF